MQIRLRLITNGQTRYLFNRGTTWNLLREDGSSDDMGLITAEPVLFAFALEDTLHLAGGEGPSKALAIAKLFCPASKVNLIHQVTKPSREPEPAPAEPRPIDLAALGLDCPTSA